MPNKWSVSGDIHTQFVTQNVKMTFSVQKMKISVVARYFFIVKHFTYIP